MKRRLWIAAAVWVAFWSLYPTFGRPRAFVAAFRVSELVQDACDRSPGPGQGACYLHAQVVMREALAPITLRNEYAGYAPLWFGVGVGVPFAGALALMGMRRRRLA